MKTLVAPTLAITLAGLATPALAGLNADICRQKAIGASGYSGPLLGWQVGRFKFRVSGSVSIGVSRSSGPQSGKTAPPYASLSALDRRESNAKEKYWRTYDDCMGN